jgi:vancomycin resistance protein VanW
LCQLSSIIYHTALRTGLDILERHPHSCDLYWGHDEQRYTPLGSDATVAYGYKDLRVRNPFSHPITLWVEIRTDGLSCGFGADSPMLSREIRFEAKEAQGHVHVQAFDMENNHQKPIATSFYRLLGE